jgi:hypothetical protein
MKQIESIWHLACQFEPGPFQHVYHQAFLLFYASLHDSCSDFDFYFYCGRDGPSILDRCGESHDGDPCENVFRVCHSRSVNFCDAVHQSWNVILTTYVVSSPLSPKILKRLIQKNKTWV